MRLTLERNLFLGRLAREEAQVLGKLGAVVRVLVDAELQVLAKGLVELLEAILVLGDLTEHLKALLDEVLANDLENLILLQSLTRDVEGQVFGVDDTLDKVEILGDQVLAVIHNEDAADVELDVVALLLAFEEVEGSAVKSCEWRARDFLRRNSSPLGDEEDGLELKLTLHGEVLNSQVVLPVISQALVERSVFLRLDVVGVSGPDGLGLIELFVLDLLLLDLLLLLLVLGLVFVLYFLDLGLFFVFFLVFFLLLLIVVNLLEGLLANGCGERRENIRHRPPW